MAFPKRLPRVFTYRSSNANGILIAYRPSALEYRVYDSMNWI